MVMRTEFGQGPLERTLAEKDQLRQAFLLHRANPALRESVQIGTLRRQRNALNPSCLQYGLERGTEFAVAVMQHVTNGVQVSGILVHGVPRNLLHPFHRRMPGNPGYFDAASFQVEEE